MNHLTSSQNKLLSLLASSGIEFFGWACKFAADELGVSGYVTSPEVTVLAAQTVYKMINDNLLRAGSLHVDEDGVSSIVPFGSQTEISSAIDDVVSKLDCGDADAQFDLWLEITDLGRASWANTTRVKDCLRET